MHSHADYKADPFLATNAIGALLGGGYLNLFLGAGVSHGFGLPGWALLVARLLGRGDDLKYLKDLEAMSEKEVARLTDTLDDTSLNYHIKVHAALYEKVSKDLLEQLPRSPLLLSVVALLTGSCRGRIQQVFTYNYDNLLEQYLEMLGYKCCVRKAPTDFSGRADVEINHVHGYLPQSWRRDSIIAELVLSSKSYRNRRADIDSGWSACIEGGMYMKAGLFLGLSGDDGTILDVLKRAQKGIGKRGDYHGYWLMTPDAYNRNASDVIDVGMCPIPLEKERFPEFVFRACQAALHGTP